MTKSELKELANNANNQLRLGFAVKAAEKSLIRTHKTGAIIFDRAGDKPISTGWSHYSEFKFKRFPHLRSIHAEIHALLRTPHRVDLRGASIYIATIRAKSGNIGLARPCEVCLSLLIEANLRDVYYTDGSGSYCHVHLPDILEGRYNLS